jgi:NADH-quinone oxidoreductase subunit E
MLTLPADLAVENTDLIEAIDALVAEHGGDRSALIPVLQQLRVQRHEITDVAMQVIADRLGITPVEVQGVVTFYAFLGTKAVGRHIIHLCRTLSCEMAGTRQVAERLSGELGVPFGGTTVDGEFTVEWANCIGMCDQPPAMLLDRQALGHVTPDQVTEIIADLRGAAAQG